MMSKTQLAEILVNRECAKLGIDTKDACDNIYQSSTLAVALEFLGLLSEDESWYAHSRGGIAYFGMDSNGNVVCISIREILQLLPDEDVVCE